MSLSSHQFSTEDDTLTRTSSHHVVTMSTMFTSTSEITEHLSEEELAGIICGSVIGCVLITILLILAIRKLRFKALSYHLSHPGAIHLETGYYSLYINM